MPALDKARRKRNNSFNDIIGYTIREWREEQEISQTELARLADMSQAQLCRVEAGERSLTLRQAVSICDALDIPIEDLALG